MTTQEISLSQITPSVHQQIKAVQGDTGRQLRMNITDRYFSSATAGLYFERSDHTNYSVSCALVNGSFEADITQALTQPGVTKCQLKVTESNKVVSTYTFQILVEKNMTGTATPQENYTIEEALSKAEQAVTTADQANETSQTAMAEAEDARDFVQGITSELAPSIKSDALSGSIVEFDNGAKYWPVNSMVVDVHGYQEGSGDPSPTNVRAIHGWTGANVTRSGFNVWDEEWELGNISGTNGDKADGAYLIPKNYIPVIPSMEYCISSPNEQGTSGRKWVVYFYDANKNFISYNGTLTSLIQVFSVPSNCYYIKFRNNKTSTTYDNDICINLSNPLHNGEYAPSEVETFPITFPSEAGTVYKGELDVTRGKLRVDWAVVDLGTLNWTVFAVPGTEYSAFRAAMPTNSIDTIASGRSAVCEKYVVISPRAMAYQNMPDKSVDVCDGNLSASKYVLIRDDSYTDAATFKAEMDGVLMAYGLQTPQEYDLTPTEVTTILGRNYIWADCGDVKELILTQDTKEYVDRRLDTNGYYDGLTVGLSEQLLSKNRVVDQTPYLYRQTALGKANATRALMRKIVGGSVVWNQLVTFAVVEGLNNGITYTQRDDGSVLVNGTATGSSFSNIGTTIHGINDHVVLLHGCPDRGEHTFYGRDGYTTSKYDIGQGLILKKVSDNLIYQIVVPSGETVNNVVFKPQIHDLTAMFGSTIADYIYSLEQATAGSGIAKLREWGFFTEDYYDYDPGTMRSVEGVSAKETVGFNLFDRSLATVGKRIDNNGNIINQSSSQPSALSDYIRVLPNHSYYLKNVHGIGFFYSSAVFDSNKNFIGILNVSGPYLASGIVTIPANGRFLRVNFNGDYVDSASCNLSDPQRNGEYEPYVKHTYPLDSTKEWRGVFKLDADNNLYADGDIYPSSGEASRRYALVDLGTLNWTYRSAKACFNANLTVKGGTVNMPSDIICTKYVSANSVNYSAWQDNPDKSIFTSPNDGYLVVRDTGYTDAATFKTAMSGIYAVYPLATEATETAEPYTEVQVVDKDGTEQFVTTGIVPVGHVTEYPEDLVGKLDSIPELPTDNGTYQLQATVNSGVVTYTWVAV